LGYFIPPVNKVTVIIPSRNDAAHLPAAIESAHAAGASEVLVADGEGIRAVRLNRAAERAAGDCLIFLHADTRLPPSACEAVAHALANGSDFGGFRLRFAEPSWRLSLAAALINLRTGITRCPWGDQAQFVRRADFLRAGGFREIAIMEDYDLAIRMKRRILLPLYVTTSGRRFLEKGMLRTAWINWRTIVEWRLGADPAELARRYRG
jgi:glycosyltransferase involved in cell wall biosynthesis